MTSNSWEYSGDWLEMAYEAGAELMDIEFTQFHPTGMVWPPSVRGTLVTEGVRGEGGHLRNSDGERFMFRYIPERFASETADTEEEGARWLAGDKEARRPPELLTRDVVARAIYNEVKAGRGSPHGGAFLDIASNRPADYIQRKLPSMYHQFKELAEVDITNRRHRGGGRPGHPRRRFRRAMQPAGPRGERPARHVRRVAPVEGRAGAQYR